MCTQRPGPLRWTWYAFGGKLPDRHREWVLNDVTCRTWWLRHIARSLVQLTPVAILLLVVRWNPIRGRSGEARCTVPGVSVRGLFPGQARFTPNTRLVLTP